MALVVLIDKPDQLTAYIEADIRRWWRHRVVKRVRDGETFFVVAEPVRFNAYEGVKRLGSFGVAARVARREV